MVSILQRNPCELELFACFWNRIQINTATYLLSDFVKPIRIALYVDSILRIPMGYSLTARLCGLVSHMIGFIKVLYISCIRISIPDTNNDRRKWVIASRIQEQYKSTENITVQLSNNLTLLIAKSLIYLYIGYDRIDYLSCC